MTSVKELVEQFESKIKKNDGLSKEAKERLDKRIAAAKAELNLGQHWRAKEPFDKAPTWPTDILILETQDFSMGGVVSLCLAPPKLKGKHFPVRADVILDEYALVYDPFQGYVWPFTEETE